MSDVLPNFQDIKTPRRIMILVVLFFSFCLGLSVPAVGIAVEYFYISKDECGSSRLATVGFYIYCSFNFFRYAWAYCVRIAMVYATVTINKIWKNVKIENNVTTAEALHATLTDQYDEAGKRVKSINKVFQTWFLFPWVIFFIASSLDAKNILAIWNNEREKVLQLPIIYFVLYNINQMVLLIIPYMCGRNIDHNNEKCNKRIKAMQLKNTHNDKFRAEQRKMLIEKEENYDFVPHVWGLGFRVKMNSFIYIVFLLLGLFLTICGALI